MMEIEYHLHYSLVKNAAFYRGLFEIQVLRTSITPEIKI